MLCKKLKMFDLKTLWRKNTVFVKCKEVAEVILMLVRSMNVKLMIISLSVYLVYLFLHILFIIPPSPSSSQIIHTVATHHTHRCTHTYTQMRQMKAVLFSSAQLVPTNLQMKSFAKSVLLLLGHGSTLCVWGWGVRREEGLTEGVYECVCVCGRSPDEAALARGSLSARGSSKPVPSFPARRDHLFH